MLGSVIKLLFCRRVTLKMNTILNLLIIIATAQAGEGLYCHVCNSAIDKKCGNPVDVTSISGMKCEDLLEDLPHHNNRKKMLLNQTENYVYACQKLQISDLQARKLIIRSCSIVRNKRANKFTCSLNDSISAITGGVGTVDYCGMCYTDYCNTGIRLAYIPYTILFAVAVMLSPIMLE